MSLISLGIKEVINSYTKLHVTPKNLSGKTVFVTGGNEGIGFETALQLAKMSAKVIIASRNLQKSELAVEKIKELSHNDDIHCRQLDLGSIQNVNKFSEQFKLDFPVLDILINNAGLNTFEFSKTEDDIERICHVNYLGPTQLTLNLLPLLLKSESPRIINVSSKLHHLASLSLPKDLNSDPADFIGVLQYSKSKLMNILFTKELAKQLKDTPVKVASLHPGHVYTQIIENELPEGLMRYLTLLIVHPMHYILARRTDQGAMTSVFCAIDYNIISGEYYDSCKVAELSSLAYDEDLQKTLWEQTLHKLKINEDIISNLL